MDEILIQDLTLHLHIGVTDKEQRRSQKLLISTAIEPAAGKIIEDAIENTIDYSAVRRGLLALLGERRFKLVETVAEETAQYVLDNFNAQRVTVTVKKFPYKDTAYVGCRTSLAKSE